MADYYLNSGVGVLYTISTLYTVGQRIYATSGQTAARKQRVYEVTTGGTSAASEPAWNTTVGGTTTSGGATFTTRNPITWANANGFLNYLCGAVLVAGDRIFVKNTHSESIAGVASQNTIGSSTSPVKLLCVSDANEPPTTLATGALIASTGGMNLGTGIEEAISRLEAGEDPEKLEAELGELFDTENPFSTEGIRGLKRKYAPPAHDDTLYVL